MVAPYPVLDEPGVVEEIQREFVRSLRTPLAGLRLFAGRESRVAHWGIENFTWREVSEMDDIVVSMDIPPVRGDSGTVTKREVTLPIFSKDLIFNGRAWRQIRETGLDVVSIGEMGRAMAVEIDNYLLFGNSGGAGEQAGLLNATGINTVTGGNWGPANTDRAKTVNADLSAAMQEIVVDDHPGTSFSVVIHPTRLSPFNQFIANTNVRIGQNLPGGAVLGGGISAVLTSKAITADDVYVIANDPGNYFWVSPRNEDGMQFGLGAATAGLAGSSNRVDMEKRDEFMKERIVRLLNIITPRVVRATAVARIDITHT